MKPALSVLCLLVLYLTPASASPSEISQYLMRTPVSMMTYGASELERMLNGEKNRLGVSNVAVTYDFDSDRITIIPSCYNCGLEATEQVCGGVIAQIRAYAQVADGKGTLFKDGTSTFARYFEQTGFGLPSTPKDMRQQIDKIIAVKVFILQNAAPDGKPGDKPSGKPVRKVLQCEAPLLGTGYSVNHP